MERLLPGAELTVPTVVNAELERLVGRQAPRAAAARAFARRLRPVRTSGHGDEAVVKAAIRLRAAVVTADRKLAERLRREGVAVLVPRDRARLELKLPLEPDRTADDGRVRRPRPNR